MFKHLIHPYSFEFRFVIFLQLMEELATFRKQKGFDVGL